MFDISNGRNFTGISTINGKIDKTTLKGIVCHLKLKNAKLCHFSKF